jgi:hypothetical protein
MKRFIAMTCAALFGLTLAAATAGATPSGSPGQPNQSCQATPAPPTPGQAATARGSAFNPIGTAGGVYAGTQPQNSQNPKSVSQYDVACFQLTP